MFACIQVSLVIMYILLTNPCNYKICVATFTQTPFMYYDTSTYLNGGAFPIISLLHTFNNNFLMMYLGIPRKYDNMSSLIDLNTFSPFLCIKLLFKLLIKLVVDFSQYFIVYSILQYILTNFCYNLLMNLH